MKYLKVVATVLTALELLLTLGAGTVRAQTSWGLGVLPNGALLFCDRARATVWRISPDGERTAALPGVTCHTIVSGTDGAVYGESIPGDVTASRGVALWRVTAGGQREWLLPPTFNPPVTEWVVRDRQGRGYSWNGVGSGSQDSQVLVRDGVGLVDVLAGATWGQQDGFRKGAALGHVVGMALAPDGSLLLADSGKIRRISPEGEVRTEARGVLTDSRRGLTSAPGLWARELGIAAARNGDAVVVDPEAGRIIRVDRQGHATPIWEPAGLAQRLTGGRWGWRPAGVAMMGQTYYVVDEWMGPALIGDLIGSPRVSQVDASGTVTRVASVADWIARCAAVALVVVVASTLFARRRRAA